MTQDISGYLRMSSFLSLASIEIWIVSWMYQKWSLGSLGTAGGWKYLKHLKAPFTSGELRSYLGFQNPIGLYPDRSPVGDRIF